LILSRRDLSQAQREKEGPCFEPDRKGKKKGVEAETLEVVRGKVSRRKKKKKKEGSAVPGPDCAQGGRKEGKEVFCQQVKGKALSETKKEKKSFNSTRLLKGGKKRKGLKASE